MPFVRVEKRYENAKSLQPSANQKSNKVLAEELNLKSASGIIEQDIYRLLAAKDFNAVEKIANSARKNKERLVGGYWKLDAVYTAAATIYADYPGQEVTDEMWKNRIEILKNWKEALPESITARVALAKAYMGYGWFARGDGYINTVSKENYDLLHERLEMAENELLDADNLKVKCPGWYREMLFLGMVNGWSPDDYNQLYEEAIKFEPNYLQFYLVKSEALTPKWKENPGDWQKFVDELPGKLATLGTDEADIIYFIVVVNKLRERSLAINYAMLAKERIKNGFADLDKKYGVDNLRLNQLALVSCQTNDFPLAMEAFKRIGNDSNKEVWGEREFNDMKKFAGLNANREQK